MPSPALGQIMDALASQIQTGVEIENLQVDGRFIVNPTPPAVDIYPADPFMESLAYGNGNKSFFFTVRARVTTADSEGGQDLLLEIMDPRVPPSLEDALLEDRTLGGLVQNLKVEGPSAFGIFPDPGLNSGSLMGCTWTVQVIP